MGNGPQTVRTTPEAETFLGPPATPTGFTVCATTRRDAKKGERLVGQAVVPAQGVPVNRLPVAAVAMLASRHLPGCHCEICLQRGMDEGPVYT